MTVACEGHTTMKCGHNIQNSQISDNIWLSSVNPRNMLMYWMRDHRSPMSPLPQSPKNHESPLSHVSHESSELIKPCKSLKSPVSPVSPVSPMSPEGPCKHWEPSRAQWTQGALWTQWPCWRYTHRLITELHTNHLVHISLAIIQCLSTQEWLGKFRHDPDEGNLSKELQCSNIYHTGDTWI